jgi:hypothetical protein
MIIKNWESFIHFIQPVGIIKMGSGLKSFSFLINIPYLNLMITLAEIKKSKLYPPVPFCVCAFYLPSK